MPSREVDCATRCIRNDATRRTHAPTCQTSAPWPGGIKLELQDILQHSFLGYILLKVIFQVENDPNMNDMKGKRKILILKLSYLKKRIKNQPLFLSLNFWLSWKLNLTVISLLSICTNIDLRAIEGAHYEKLTQPTFMRALPNKEIEIRNLILSSWPDGSQN